MMQVKQVAVQRVSSTGRIQRVEVYGKKTGIFHVPKISAISDFSVFWAFSAPGTLKIESPVRFYVGGLTESSGG